MTAGQRALIATAHRVATAERRACGRVARLLAIGELEARAVVGMVAGTRTTTRTLQADFDLSPGGAAAFAERLTRERLARAEPDPAHPSELSLRLTEGAALELEAALAGFASEIQEILAQGRGTTR